MAISKGKGAPVADKKILIVDDEVHIRDIIKFRLQVEGYEILEASNGRNAIDIMMSDKPDLVVLDIMMPDMDGWEVCKFAKGQSETKDIPILMLTAKTDIRDKIQGMVVGANDFVTKPFSPNDLVQRVSKLLATSQTSES